MEEVHVFQCEQLKLIGMSVDTLLLAISSCIVVSRIFLLSQTARELLHYIPANNIRMFCQKVHDIDGLLCHGRPVTLLQLLDT